MGLVKRALVSIAALALGALLVANWRWHGETQRKLEELAGAILGRSPEPATPTSQAPSTPAPAEPRPLPTSVVTPAGGTMSATPAQVIQPPDVLHVEVLLRDPRTGRTEPLPVQPISGEFLVRPDGHVGLGVWGFVRVAGLTPEKAVEEVRRKLTAFTQVNGTSSGTDRLHVTVQVKSNNSKVYYVFADVNGSGEQVFKFPCSGRETVLDAIAAVPGLAAVADRRKIEVVRRGSSGAADAVLPVDWAAIIQRGDTRTNYILQPGDRVHVTASR
jgi:polysaccharide biosynthesis/export protein